LQSSAVKLFRQQAQQVHPGFEPGPRKVQSVHPGLTSRHHSVRVVFDYAWNLLTSGEQCILAILSLFRGGFCRAAGQAVTNATLRELMSLTNKSLLQRTPAGRYQIHEQMRQYAAEKLHTTPCEAQAGYDAHAAYYAAFLQALALQLHTSSHQQVIQ
jgi:predicted ATPase